MSKRSNGDGSLFQRSSDGRWFGVVWVEDARGEKKRTTVSAKTRTEAKRRMETAQERVKAGQPVRDSADTIEAWVAHWSTSILPNTGRRPATVDNYRGLLVTHVVPALGRKRLGELKPSHVEAFLSDLGTRRSGSTVRAVYAALRACIGDAVRDGLLARNVVEDVKRPKAAAPKPKALDDESVRAILAATSGHRLHPLVALVATTGLRRGEALALRWSDLDLDAGTLTVAQALVRTSEGLTFGPPKTERGRRSLVLMPKMVALLKRHRKAQAVERLAVGESWADLDLVFCTEVGTPCEPRNVSRWYAEACESAGVSEVGMHALRHSAATGMLAAGVPVRAVADRLGHSDVALTLNVYAATLDEHAERAAQVREDALLS